MAAKVNTKRPANLGHGVIKLGDYRGGQSVVKRRRANVKWLKQPANDLWQRLPAELKNTIYELVLSNEQPVLIGKRSQFHRFTPKKVKKTRKRWVEPPLFAVSKSIRLEAQSMYYRLNKIHLIAAIDDVSSALSWVTKMPWVNGDILSAHNLNINVIEIAWANIPDWTLLAMLIFKHTDPISARSQEAEVDAWVSLFPINDNTYRLGAAFKQMVQISVRSRRRGLESDLFKQDIRDWAMAYIVCFDTQYRHRRRHDILFTFLENRIGPSGRVEAEYLREPNEKLVLPVTDGARVIEES